MNISNLPPSGAEEAGVRDSSYMVILKSIAISKETPENDPADLCTNLDEVEIEAGEPIFKKGS